MGEWLVVLGRWFLLILVLCGYLWGTCHWEKLLILRRGIRSVPHRMANGFTLFSQHIPAIPASTFCPPIGMM